MLGRCKHCAETVTRIDRLESQWRQQVVEYELLYEKARVALSRLARREKADAPCDEAEPAPTRDPVSERILARRNRFRGLSQNSPDRREG